MRQDPMQLTNCAERYPETVARLSEWVLVWQATLPEGPGDPVAGSKAYPWPKGTSKR
jgi:hypothetical protein